jgi:hypothetical protein
VEIWKEIPNHIGYEISSLGNLRTRRKYKANKYTLINEYKKLNPHINNSGYRMCLLDGKQMKISRTVMLAFFGESDLLVNHINGVKHDDRLENLEYCTASENISHAYKNGLSKSGESHYKSKLTKEQVFKIFSDSRTERTIAKDYGISQINVNRIKRKIIWKHIW